MFQGLVILNGHVDEQNWEQDGSPPEVDQTCHNNSNRHADAERQLDPTRTKECFEDLPAIQREDRDQIQDRPVQADENKRSGEPTGPFAHGAEAFSEQEEKKKSASSLKERSSKADEDLLPPCEAGPLGECVSTKPVENNRDVPTPELTHCERVAKLVNQYRDEPCGHEKKNREKVLRVPDTKGAPAEGKDGPVPGLHRDRESKEMKLDHR